MPDRIPHASVHLSGFHSSMEQNILVKLLEENRMLILEMRSREGNLAAAEERNRFVMAQADQLWVPFVKPGGMLWRLMRENLKDRNSYRPYFSNS